MSRSSKSVKNRRKALVERDGLNCQGCGKQVMKYHPDGNVGQVDHQSATLDHIRPKSKSGSGRVENLQLMCPDCNNAKGDSWDGESGEPIYRDPLYGQSKRRFQVVPGGLQLDRWGYDLS